MQSTYRLIILAGLAVSASLCQGQDLNQKISLTAKGMTAPRLLDELTKVTNIRFSSGTQTQNDVLCVRLKDVTIQQAMDQIAAVVDGEWRPSDGGYLLTRTGAAELKQQREEAARRGKKLEAAIKKMLGEVEQKPKLTEEDVQKMAAENRQQIEQITRGLREGGGGEGALVRSARAFSANNRMSPGSRAITRILATIDPDILGAMGPGTRTVFATRPTQMQKPLPGAATKIIDQFLEEQRLVEQTAPVGGSGGRADIAILGAGGQSQRAQTAKPGKVLLIVSRFGTGDGLQCQLSVADAQTGDFFATGMGFVSLAEEIAPPAGKNSNEQPIAISDLTKQFAGLVTSVEGGARGTVASFVAVATGGDVVSGQPLFVGANRSKPSELSPDWRSRLLQPDVFEPLSTAPSEILLGIAEQRNLNLVAALPDSALLPSLRRIQNSVLYPTEALAMAPSWDLEITATEGWLTVKPLQPFTAVKERISRKSLAAMLKTLNTAGRLSLDDLAAYAITTDAYNVLASIDYTYLKLLDPTTAERQLMQTFQGNGEMLKFYGYMPQGQRTSLLNGQPLSIASFNQKQRELTHSMVYNSMDGPRIETPGPGGGRPGPGGPGGPMMMMMGRGNLASERTEALPTGIPTNGMLTVRANREEAVLATDAEGGNSQFLTADALGRFRALANNVRGAEIAGLGMNFEKFQMGEQTALNFRFDFTRNATLNRRLTDDKVDKKTAPVGFDQLPREFRRRAEIAAQRMQRGTGRELLPQGGAGAPPPSR
ncbi:MAG: hypothetical protein K1X67_00605 [Fimbriimonadaceae bacterium]|nr:hypothetical protein [Fimbriimonadaceae bacterium]